MEYSITSAKKAQLVCCIRWMIRGDMSEVLDIEESSFEHPWPEDEFARCLRERNCVGMVAEHDEKVVGFMIYELHKTRLRLLDFAVHPDFRRREIGKQMITQLIGKLSPQRRTRITLVVCERNLSAQLFFRSLGFRAVSVVYGFYEEIDADAYFMEYRLN